ncbi:MAG: argininosuccinate synthase [Gemmataceae bacterium]
MARVVFAFNGDLESRLALHWLVREEGHEVLAFSANLGQGIYLEPLGELALELGAVSAQVIDLRASFLEDFCLPTLQADAVYQSGCFLASALARYAIARELVRLAEEEGAQFVAHSAASKGNDQVRLETAVAAQNPQLRVLAPVRRWPLRTMEDKLRYAEKHRLPVDRVGARQLSVDRNLWGVSLYLDELVDLWHAPPDDVYQITRAPVEAPDQPTEIVVGFEQGVPRRLDDREVSLVHLVSDLNRIGGEHAIGRLDVIEDRLLGIKSRELYEVPAPTILLAAHQALQALVLSRDVLNWKESLSRRYGELVYSGQWFSDLRRSLQNFIAETQRFVTGDVRLQLYKGSCTVTGRRSPYSLYDPRLASASNQEFFEDDIQGISSIWTLPARLTARQRQVARKEDAAWTAP